MWKRWLMVKADHQIAKLIVNLQMGTNALLCGKVPTVLYVTLIVKDGAKLLSLTEDFFPFERTSSI